MNTAWNDVAVASVTLKRGNGIEVTNRLYGNGSVTSQTYENGTARTLEVEVGRKWTGKPSEWLLYMNRATK